MSEVHSIEEARRAAARPDPARPEPARPEPPEAAPPDLAQLVAARICHDVLSPLGAVANGVELLALSGVGGPAGADTSPEMALIGESVDAATARMRFFRLAYGPAAPGQTVGPTEVRATLGGLARGGRLRFDWAAEGEQPRDEVRAVFLLLQCVEAALPLGGRVAVSRGPVGWQVVAEGPRLRIDEAAWAALRDPRARPPAQAALVQFALLPEALAGMGRTLSLDMGPDRIAARF